MSESQEPQPVESVEGFNPSSYETIRDETPGITHATRYEWQQADRRVADLRQTWSSLQEDQDYTPEARARKAEEHYARQKDRIESAWAQTRQDLRNSAALSERMSIPRPQGQPLEAKDSNDLLAAQGERDRIVRTLDRHASRGGPFNKPAAADFLKTEYQAGMEQGGVTGAARCRGVMAAVEELGVGLQWIDSLRDDKQRKYLDDARRLEQAAFAVPSTAPKPPKSLQQAVNRARGQEMQQRRPLMFIPRGGSAGETHLVSEPSHNSGASEVSPPRPASKRRKKSWK